LYALPLFSLLRSCFHRELMCFTMGLACDFLCVDVELLFIHLRPSCHETVPVLSCKVVIDCYIQCCSGDQGKGSINRIDVATIAVACVEGHCTPDVTFEVFNSRNKYAPLEDLNKLYSLDSDEPVLQDSEITGRLLP